MKKKETEFCPDCGGKLKFMYKTGTDEMWHCEECGSAFYSELKKPPSQKKLF